MEGSASAGGDAIICRALLLPVLYAGLLLPQGNDPEVSTSEEVSIYFVFSCFSFSVKRPFGFWINMKGWAGAARMRLSAALCDEEGVEEVSSVCVRQWDGCCVRTEGFQGGHPSCQSCLDSISGLFRGVNTPVQQRFCLQVRAASHPPIPRCEAKEWKTPPTEMSKNVADALLFIAHLSRSLSLSHSVWIYSFSSSISFFLFSMTSLFPGVYVKLMKVNEVCVSAPWGALMRSKKPLTFHF